ncbi:MAG: PIN domain-containing protein [Verrucomicrobia bacterium]|jgi:PIN domain nuclease of toxin-antitoxin system|nr:PIN domain-containing protein [Verrucomicrobiota bacterium]
MGSLLVKAILDTHAAIWAAEDDPRLGVAARALLSSLTAEEAGLPDIALLEISMLEKKRRISLKIPLPEYLGSLSRMFKVLPLSPPIASCAMELALPQGDPFDRIIAATAIQARLPLLTRDRHLRNLEALSTIWD